MDFKLVINGQGTTCDATRLIEGTMKLTSERRGSPAKLEFSVMRHEGLAFYEGNQVALTVKGVPMFCGYVFKKKRKKDQLIQVTAYDQLRYLKNKDTLVYENKTASQVITMLAADYKLKTGPIADTGYVIPCRSEDMQTLMDIMYNALDLTLINAGELYVLYDDFGALTLKNIRDMRLNVVISSRYKMIDFDYATDIDQDTANRVKLVKDNNDTGRREAYIEMDSGNMAKWGILQMTEKVDENMTEAQIIQRAQQLLKNYNRVRRTLSVENLGGDLRVRGGSSLFVEIPDLGDISLKKLLMVSKCVHVISNNEHTMNLNLEGLE